MLKRQSENVAAQESLLPQKFDTISKRVLNEKNTTKVDPLQKKHRINRLKQRNEETGDCKQQ
jgi:hypothetical protein